MTTPLQRQLRKATTEGLITEREFDGLFIYTYTQQCVKDRAWSKITRMARGLILDSSGNIVARPFDKFFNLGEHPETEHRNLPKCGFSVEEKIDGSCGICFWNPIRECWDIATKGALHSEQADYAREELLPRYDFSQTSHNDTIITEIIYPENKIVIDYDGWRGLRLLGVRNKHTGKEEPAGRIPILATAMRMGFRHYFPKLIDFYNLPMEKNMEGYVIRFDNGLRIKIKNLWYLRIHRALEHKSLKHIIELVEGNEWRGFWNELPKELQKEFDDLYAQIRTMCWDIEHKAEDAWSQCSNDKVVIEGRNGRHGRKAFALWVQKNVEPELHPIMYAILDGHSWKHYVYSIVKRNLKREL